MQGLTILNTGDVNKPEDIDEYLYVLNKSQCWADYSHARPGDLQIYFFPELYAVNLIVGYQGLKLCRNYLYFVCICSLD